MKKLLVLLVMFTLLSASDKVALVIGNKSYTNQTGLKNSIRDAKLIRDTLQGMGFEVVEAYDKNLNGLSTKLDVFIGKARNAKIAVVYYAGHGIGVGSRNYLIPLGATSLSKSNLSRKLLSVDELKEAVANAKGFGVVLFDACRNSFFSGAISGLSSGRTSRALVQPTVTRANVLVSFSTQAGTKAEDDVNGGEHSPYAIALRSENLKNNRDIRLVMGSIRTRVYGLTANQQYPIEKNMLDGKDYCLSGSCKKIIDSSQELARLEAENTRLKQQQQNRVPQIIVRHEAHRDDSSTNKTKTGNKIWQEEKHEEEINISCPEINKVKYPLGNFFPSFNCFTDNEGALGKYYGGDTKEQNFVRIRKDKGSWTDSIDSVNYGDIITVLVYIHNAAKDNIKIFEARDVEVELNWANSENIRAKISASNTYPKVIHDNTFLSLSSTQKLQLEYFKENKKTYQNNRKKSTHIIHKYDSYPSGYPFAQASLYYFKVVKNQD